MKITIAKQDSKIKNCILFVSSSQMKQNTTQEKAIKDFFKGSWGETFFLPNAKSSENIMFVGIEDEAQFSYEKARRAVAIAFKAFAKYEQESVKIDISSLQRKTTKDYEQLSQAVTESLLLSEYQCDEFKSKPKNAKKTIKTICLCGASDSNKKAVQKGLSIGLITGQATNLARKVANYPGNYMTPSILAKEAQKVAQGTKLKVTVWDKKKLTSEKMGGILGVGAGSAEESRFIIMEYKGGPKTQKPICLVGKGVTFDTGGISLKPGHTMDEMKFDMCGAAAVLGAMTAIEKLKLKVNVLGLIPSAENMPSSKAIKPGDILTARNKKTMEILNTDAEGRLILADALSYACEQKPQAIFDAATLTGAIISALSNLFSGVFTRNEKLVSTIMKASEKTGEKIWRLPLVDEFANDMRSTIADVSNLSSSRGGGSSTAAGFLENFVEKNIPWAHFDIAGTAYNTHQRLEYCAPRAASGVMVRTFIEIARSYEQKSK